MKQIPFTIASFENFLREKKLMVPRCRTCSALWLPPRSICHTCSGDTMEWAELSGRGRLIAFTVIGVGPIPMIEAGYSRDNPYCAGILELLEVPRMSAQILGVDVAHPENTTIGTLLRADFFEGGSWHFLEDLAKRRKMYLAFRA